MSNSPAGNESTGDHLDGLESGAGCTEIWERLSEQRSQPESTEQ
jgi:hypothetical protein